MSAQTPTDRALVGEDTTELAEVLRKRMLGWAFVRDGWCSKNTLPTSAAVEVAVNWANEREAALVARCDALEAERQQVADVANVQTADALRSIAEHPFFDDRLPNREFLVALADALAALESGSEPEATK